MSASGLIQGKTIPAKPVVMLVSSDDRVNASLQKLLLEENPHFVKARDFDMAIDMAAASKPTLLLVDRQR